MSGVVFSLNDSLINDIIFSMEDQQSVWYVNAREVRLEKSDNLDSENSDFSENYYRTPEWTSTDGYTMLEDFTNNLHSPAARAELKHVLATGRGVFKNFKTVLKSYPEVERKWHLYKNKCMKKRIMEWYSSLREEWGLESLESSYDHEDSSYCEEIVRTDFAFTDYDFSKDIDEIRSAKEELSEEYTHQLNGELGKAVSFINQHASEVSDDENKLGFVCRSLEEDFAGCALVSRCPSDSKNCVVLSDFFVSKDFRGLGIGRHLLSECFAMLREQGIRFVLIANPAMPNHVEKLLKDFGFEKSMYCYAADLSRDL